MLSSLPMIVRFGPFELDRATGELRKDRVRLRLQDRPLRVLEALVERPGALVTREELRKRLWSDDTFVDFDNSLNNAINRLRAALDDAADDPRFVETVGRRGYRFVAQASTDDRPADSQPVVASQDRSHQDHVHVERLRDGAEVRRLRCEPRRGDRRPYEQRLEARE